jgi:mannose-1-phosphate guanylyltransferase/mannose-6-phosphate isomerase
MINVSPVILCGGAGTRLWPLSRAAFPKQFLVMAGSLSLFQNAVQRVNAIATADIALGETLVVTNEDHRFLARDQLAALHLPSTSLLLEPVGRNTAPALTLAALRALEGGADPVLLVSPADHAVADLHSFTTALQASVRCAVSGAIVTLSVAPVRPETGFGYIQRQGESGHHGESVVRRFVEKPDLETARAYVASGEYAWNSGVFVLRASVWLNALRHFRPDIWHAAQMAWAGRSYDGLLLRPDLELFKAIPAVSIDYAVMERCPGSIFPVSTVPLAAGWSDLGTWEAVWQWGTKDEAGNLAHGDALLMDTSNTLVHAGNRLVGTVGVKDLVIVETADAVLVTDRAHSQSTDKLVAALLQRGRREHLLHRKTHRPWGWSEIIDAGDGFNVNRIRVNAGASLSLQRHGQRTEHWVVVKGVAEVTCGDKTFLLREGESTCIPSGATHRLHNLGDGALEIIEIQSGSYPGADDIERFDDACDRARTVLP